MVPQERAQKARDGSDPGDDEQQVEIQHGGGPPPSWGLALAAALLGAGIYFKISHANDQAQLASADPGADFTSLGQVCEITVAHYSSKSVRWTAPCQDEGRRRRLRGGGSGGPSSGPDHCGEPADKCLDTISYSFTHSDETYRSRELVTERNNLYLDEGFDVDFSNPFESEPPSPPGIDRCCGTENTASHPPDGAAPACDENSAGSGRPYQGFLPIEIDPNADWSEFEPDNNEPFVCGEVCAVGTLVECWTPTSADFIAADNEWANCGNPECIKLVDPEFEYKLATDAAEGAFDGTLLIIIGAVVSGLTILCFLADLNDKRKAQRKAQQPGAGHP